MAIKNRTEAIADVNTTIVPTVTNSAHRGLLNNSILNSVVFEKDIIASETPGGGAVTIDYSNKDLAQVTTATDLTVSFTNLENGSVKYLEVTKAATNVISFSGAIDVSLPKETIKTVSTLVIYRVSNKNNNICVESINIDNNTSQNRKIVNIGDWNMDANVGVDIAHGLDASRIRTVSVFILADVGSSYDSSNKFKLDFADPNDSFIPQGCVRGVTDTVVKLSRKDGGAFDNGAFDSTSYNRGYIVIDFV